MATFNKESRLEQTYSLSDVIGECGGEVVGRDNAGLHARVYPDSYTCSGCLLFDHCSEGKKSIQGVSGRGIERSNS